MRSKTTTMVALLNALFGWYCSYFVLCGLANRLSRIVEDGFALWLQDFRVKNTAESALPTPFPPVQETKQHGSSLYIQSPATLLSRISLSTPEEAKQNSASHTFSPAELNDIEEISRMCLNEDFYLDSIDAVPEALTEPQKSFKSLSEAEKLEVEECARLCFEDIL